MGIVKTTITVTNQIDEILAERGFIRANEIRSLTIENVLVDTGASRLCLPADIVSQLGLTQAGEIIGHTAVGTRNFRLFQNVKLSIAGREGVYNCVELAGGEEPLVGVIPLEDLGLEPDLRNQQLKVLPDKGKDTYLRV
ncbi:aspartyl protease family protein [Ancylothrix sp. C2]|uniref:aspartyl protease family protein n=1 Tax=Ancylothrix sp. D3o TaxID=2953691 RepID=UPI0021BB3847|nr:aspartyl protease family protein [Ancylothrix sp. D3o]MCT7950372.1 aspartyl protease family protein [Ancylothrix sp. D3o]